MSVLTAPPTATVPAYHRLARSWAGRWRLRPLAAVLLGVALYTVEILGGALIWKVLEGAGVPLPPGLADLELTNLLDPATLAAAYLLIAAMLPAFWLGFALMGRRPGELSSVDGHLRWPWLVRVSAAALSIWLVTAALGAFADLSSGRSLGPVAGQLGVFLLVTLALTPFQAAAEEYVFRGALAQLIGTWLRHPAWAILVPVPLFVLGHGYNWVGMLDVGIFAVAAGWMTWRTGGLEAAIAMHVVNNTLLGVAAGFGLADPNQVDYDPVALVGGVLPVLALVVWVEWAVRTCRVTRRHRRPEAAHSAA